MNIVIALALIMSTKNGRGARSRPVRSVNEIRLCGEAVSSSHIMYECIFGCKAVVEALTPEEDVIQALVSCLYLYARLSTERATLCAIILATSSRSNEHTFAPYISPVLYIQCNLCVVH